MAVIRLHHPDFLFLIDDKEQRLYGGEKHWLDQIIQDRWAIIRPFFIVVAHYLKPPASFMLGFQHEWVLI